MFLRVLALVTLGCGVVHAQVSVRFFLEKTVFAPGEPVFLFVDLKNEGINQAPINSLSDTDSPLCAGISIAVSSDPPRNPTCRQSQDFVSLCMGPIVHRDLAPGETFARRFLLNFHHEIGGPAITGLMRRSSTC